jgi:hypothetical protein
MPNCRPPASDLGTLALLVEDFLLPNGLAFSPDESVLYINDSRRRHIRAFDVAPNGTLARQSDRVFADLGGAESGGPDGMKVDVAGNVFCDGAGGIYVMDAKGKKLGRIVHGQPATTNMGFGGDDWKTLFFTNGLAPTALSPLHKLHERTSHRWRGPGAAWMGWPGLVPKSLPPQKLFQTDAPVIAGAAPGRRGWVGRVSSRNRCHPKNCSSRRCSQRRPCPADAPFWPRAISARRHPAVLS